MAIQTLFDIANHIIAYQGWEEPETYRETFAILASHGVLPDKKVPEYQNMASFRNILVHHYEKVEDEVVFGIFKNKLEDFFLFKQSILEYIEKVNKEKNDP